jgi:hypothetical protein
MMRRFYGNARRGAVHPADLESEQQWLGRFMLHRRAVTAEGRPTIRILRDVVSQVIVAPNAVLTPWPVRCRVMRLSADNGNVA